MPLDPLVSVVIPAFNAAHTLGATLSSVLTQTYPHTEIIVVDDGSTDGTAEVARAYGDRVRLISQANAGVAAARNTAMAAARGDLFAFVDSDDILLPRYLEKALATWRNAGGGKRIVTTTAYFLTLEGIAPRRRVIHEVVPVQRQRLRALEGPFVAIFTVFPRALYDEIGPIDATLRTAEDFDYWLRGIFRGYEVLFQMDPQALYRRTSTSLSQNLDRLGHDEITVFRKLLDDPDVTLSPDERARIEERLALDPPLAYIQRGEEALQRGDAAAAAREFAVASRLLPSNSGLRRKALLLRAPLTGPVLARLQARRRQET